VDKEESRSLISKLIKDGIIVKPVQGTKEFFLNKSIESLQISKRIFEIAENETLKSYMWTITTAYYSMFFAATSLLAHFGHKIKSEIGIHKLTYHALVYYFLIADHKLQKQAKQKHWK